MPDLKKGDRFQFHFQKSPQYRTIHCDGVYGGVTPRAYITMTMYNERNVVPRILYREVLEAGEKNKVVLGQESVEDSLSGVMRQLEATIFMDINTSREFYKWFGDKLAELEDMAGVPEAQRIVKKNDGKNK